MHKFFGGVLPETGAETAQESALRASAERVIAGFGPAFDELNFSEALKSVWVLVAETDGYLTANAPWKKPADRSDEEHAAIQARVLATAAEAIRIITALVYPILPASAAKVWRQLGLGSLDDAAGQAFLTELAWGGLKPGTQFSEPAPLFPRAEKDAIERMQNLEDENNSSAVEAAAGQGASADQPVAPTQAPASTSVAPTTSTDTQTARENDGLTPTTAVSQNPQEPVDTAKVHSVPEDIGQCAAQEQPRATRPRAPR